MEIGSKEWITRAACRLSDEAEPELEKIVTAAWDRHGMGQLLLSQADIVRLSCFVAEAQNESFRVGLRSAMELARDMAVGMTRDMAASANQGQKGSQHPEGETGADQAGVVGVGTSPPAGAGS